MLCRYTCTHIPVFHIIINMHPYLFSDSFSVPRKPTYSLSHSSFNVSVYQLVTFMFFYTQSSQSHPKKSHIHSLSPLLPCFLSHSHLSSSLQLKALGIPSLLFSSPPPHFYLPNLFHTDPIYTCLFKYSERKVTSFRTNQNQYTRTREGTKHERRVKFSPSCHVATFQKKAELA